MYVAALMAAATMTDDANIVRMFKEHVEKAGATEAHQATRLGMRARQALDNIGMKRVRVTWDKIRGEARASGKCMRWRLPHVKNRGWKRHRH